MNAHHDYVEQFLNNTKTRLYNSINLRIHYQSLADVTNNFKQDKTKIKCLMLDMKPVCIRDFNLDIENYFSDAYIC